MGYYTLKGPNGSQTTFQIKGNSPSQTEMARIQQHMSGQGQPAKPTSDLGILGSFSAGFGAGIDETQAGLYTAAQGLAEQQPDKTLWGRTADDYLKLANEQRQQAEEARKGMPEGGFFDQEGLYNKAKYLAGQAGNTGAAQLGGLATMVGGSAAGAAVGGPAGAAIGTAAGILGGSAIYAPQNLNSNAERQIEQYGRVKDWGKAVGATVAQSVVESFTDRLTLGVAGLLKKPVMDVAERLLLGEAVKAGAEKGLTTVAKRIGAAGAVGTISGATEEAVQQGLERWQADLSLTNPEALSEYIESAVVGGILQGAMGASFGGAGGFKEARNNKAWRAAIEDADAEGEGNAKAFAEYTPKYAAQRDPFKKAPASALLEDLRPNEQITDFGESRMVGREPFTEEEYASTLQKLRGEKSISPDKIKMTMRVGRPKANAIFDAMVNRNDAVRTGSESQYLRIIPKREYVVAPLASEDALPYRVEMNGKQVGKNRFKTEDEATEWANRVGLKKFEVAQDTATQRFGLYETQYETDPVTKEKRLVGKRAVKAFGTHAEATSAAQNLDPAFSLETNVANEVAQGAERDRLIKIAVQKELGGIAKNLQKKADTVLGEGRASIHVVPMVDADYLRKLGVPEDRLPSQNEIVEGVTLPDPKDGLRQIIALSSDIYDPNLAPDAKQQRIESVLNHEIVHALRNLDILTGAEWDHLFKHAMTEKVAGKPYTHAEWAVARNLTIDPSTGNRSLTNPREIPEEAIAEMLRKYMNDPTAFTSKERGLLKRLADFVRKLIGLGQRYGAEDVMKAIFGGDVATRRPGAGGLGARYEGNPFYSTVQVPGLYMLSDKVVGDSTWKQAKASEWMSYLRNKNVKKAELDWLGIEDWLKQQEGPISKGDVQDYIRANAVDLKEIVRRGLSLSEELRLDSLQKSLHRDYDDDVNSHYQSFEEWLKEPTPFAEDNASEYLKLLERANDALAHPPKFAFVQQPGGKNYTEVQFIIPTLDPPYQGSHWSEDNTVAHARFNERTIDGKWTLFIEEIQSDLHQQGKRKGYLSKDVSTKMVALGKRLLEIDQELANLNSARAKIPANRQLSDNQSTEYYTLSRRINDLRKERSAVNEQYNELDNANEEMVPDAPFKTTWDELSFKRLVRYAAEEGFDQIAWHGEPDSVANTEGYQTMQRVIDDEGNVSYKLADIEGEFDEQSPDVTGIINTYTKRLKSWSDHYFRKFNTGVVFRPSEAQTIQPEELFPNKMDFIQGMDSFRRSEGVFGEPVNTPKGVRVAAAKAIQIAQQQRDFDLEAALKPVMDKMTWPEFVRTFFYVVEGKPFSDQVDQHGNPDYGKWVMPISDELRESVLNNGLPMFSKTQVVENAINNPNFQTWFKNSKVLDENGLPDIVYHGTRASVNFDRFRRLSHFGTAAAANDRLDTFLDDGALDRIAANFTIAKNKIFSWWMGLSPEERERLLEKDKNERINSVTGQKSRTNMRIYPTFLSIQNPLEIIDDGVLESLDDYKEAVGNALINKPGSGMARVKTAKATNFLSVVEALEEAGYDGFRYVNQVEDIGSTSWVVFRPEQIKSVFNRGSFSPNDPRINYSKTEVKPAVERAINDYNFRKWFRGSQITDRDGNPLVMYHGTNADIDAFKRDKIGRTDSGWFGRGFYFTSDPGYAEMYTSDYNPANIAKVKKELKDQVGDNRYEPSDDSFPVGEYQAQIYPVFLNIRNPYHMSIPVARKADALRARNPEISGKLSHMLQMRGHDGIIIHRTSEWADERGFREVVAFRPSQIKSVFNFGTWYEGTDQIRYSATAPMGQRVPSSAPPDKLDQIESKITYNNLVPSLQKLARPLPAVQRYKTEQAIEDTFIGLQDRMLSVGKLIDRMKKNGGFISNENDTYLREVLFSGQTDAAIQDNQKVLYQPLYDAIKKLSVTSKDAAEAAKLHDSARTIINNYPDPKKALTELYLYALHAQERNAKMRYRNERLQDERLEQYHAGSGMDDAEAREILDWFAKKPFNNEFRNVRDLFQHIITSTNDIRVAGGLNPDFRKMINKNTGLPVDDYKNYAPLRSWVEEHLDQDEDALAFAKTGKGFNIHGKEDFSATGRSSLASNLVEHAVLQNEEAIVRAGKNKVSQSFLQLIRDNPDAMKEVAEIISVKPLRVVYDSKTGRARMATDSTIMTDPNILKVKEGGKQAYIRIHDPRIAKALGSRASLGNAGAGAFIKMLLGLNRFLAATRTSYNPEFLVSNLLRDLEAALVNVSEFDLPGVRKKVITNVFPAMKNVYQSLRDGNPNSQWVKDYDEFKKMGGMTAFFGIRNLNDTIKKVNSALSQDYSGAPQKVWGGVKAVFNWVEDTNLAIENATRLATYVSVRDELLRIAGNPTDDKTIRRVKERAAFISKNLTVNFNMGGELKPVMNGLYLFFNAGLQGSMALLNPMIRSKRMRRIWLSVLAAGFIQDQLMALFSGDDDDGKKTYDKIPQYVLEHNIVFMDPFGLSKRGYFKIPLPYLMNGIYNAGRAMSRGIRGGATIGESLGSIAGTMAESLNPWGGANTFLNFIAPTVVDPIIDLYTNEDFSGTPIAPTSSPFGIQEKNSQRYWNNTNPAYVSIADWMSRLTGGEGQYIPGAAEWSPNQIQYMVEQVTGGTGTFATRIYDLVAGKNVIEEMLTGGDVSANDIPFLRRAYGNITTRNDLDGYIKNRDRLLTIRAELRDAAKEGDSERYQMIMQEYPEEYRLSSAINRIENARKKISRQISKIRDSNKIPDSQKKQMIDALKQKQDALVGQANALMNQ